MQLNWDNANNWLLYANKGKEEFYEPKWSWDCNFKLDFDGPIITVSSRFYPPTLQYGPGWDGKVAILFLGVSIMEKEFKCETIEELKRDVEAFLKHYSSVLKSRI